MKQLPYGMHSHIRKAIGILGLEVCAKQTLVVVELHLGWDGEDVAMVNMQVEWYASIVEA